MSKKAVKEQKVGMNTRLQKEYYENIRPLLVEKFGYKNPHEVPKLDKIVINMGVGEATQHRAHIT